MAQYQIPVTASPQQFSIQLGTNSYQVKLYWNWINELWQLDFATIAGVPIISGIPLVAGVDLLADMEYLGFGGSLYAATEGTLLPPTYTNLGTEGRLIFETADEVSA